MKPAWMVAALSSLVATGASIAAERSDAGLVDGVFLTSFIIGTVLIVGLHARYRMRIGRFFEGTNRFRIHVLTVGDIAVILLALRIFSAGLGLALLTAVIFSHNIFKSYAHEAAFGTPRSQGDTQLRPPLNINPGV